MVVAVEWILLLFSEKMTWQELKEETIYIGIAFFFLWGIPFVAVAAVLIFIIYAGVTLINGC